MLCRYVRLSAVASSLQEDTMMKDEKIEESCRLRKRVGRGYVVDEKQLRAEMTDLCLLLYQHRRFDRKQGSDRERPRTKEQLAMR